MNHIQEISTNCQTLPEELQIQVLDFINFLEVRYTQNQTVEEDNISLTDAELEQACGILKAPHSVSLAEMDLAKKKPWREVMIAVDNSIYSSG